MSSARPELVSPITEFASRLAELFDVPHVLEQPAQADADALAQAVILLQLPDISAGVLADMRDWLDPAPVALLSVPAGCESPDALEQRLHAAGLRVEFVGRAASSPGGDKDRVLAVLANHHRPPLALAPDSFRVVAIMRAYNEIDIIEPVVRYTAAQGVDVYIIDNWSTDGTYERAQALQSQGVIGVERFPPDGPPELFQHKQLLERIETVSRTLDASWIIHHDIDEFRESPWPDVTLRDALYHVDRCGYTAINHLMINFYAPAPTFQSGDDPQAHFTRFELQGRSGFLMRVNAWKNTGQRVHLVPTGGHRVDFPDCRVYPYRFLIRHYPLRQPEQAARKIRDRQRRVPRLARWLGWHHAYDHLDPDDETLFEELCHKARDQMPEFDPATFYDAYLIERLSGIGLPGTQAEPRPTRRPTMLRRLVTPLLRRIRYLLRRLI